MFFCFLCPTLGASTMAYLARIFVLCLLVQPGMSIPEGGSRSFMIFFVDRSWPTDRLMIQSTEKGLLSRFIKREKVQKSKQT